MTAMSCDDPTSLKGMEESCYRKITYRQTKWHSHLPQSEVKNRLLEGHKQPLYCVTHKSVSKVEHDKVKAGDCWSTQQTQLLLDNNHIISAL